MFLVLMGWTIFTGRSAVRLEKSLSRKLPNPLKVKRAREIPWRSCIMSRYSNRSKSSRQQQLLKLRLKTPDLELIAAA
ncbi:hypothetical protein SEN110799_10070 [Salmonella enterica subsp. enterica serovar Kentucky]|uniref:Uncharacterized protein n=4 Tax=Salmonella TaxID=590 RepID=C0PX63_SALPC|nr:hypothetical protein SPC_0875 [Salmonella enterica subsp. enterica serovar Paratyphi C str. RKS4594]AGS30810.1 hypothetical protein SN31241_38390 [Salmonella enterica subsp. enterica serovar Newport str. USMARC-S3124.1]EHC84094.1 hypothetical protein LTSESEN_4316 [Salmonella enterica subsp. enterica serovar Senftenberg str. A4-543]CAH2853346.1 hypothetical protein SEN110799_10070 [Salmonella enterica subsp. enterica serovar Kentucky]